MMTKLRASYIGENTKHGADLVICRNSKAQAQDEAHLYRVLGEKKKKKKCEEIIIIKPKLYNIK